MDEDIEKAFEELTKTFLQEAADIESVPELYREGLRSAVELIQLAIGASEELDG